eukprot:4882309-Amphidinium_carterae.1
MMMLASNKPIGAAKSYCIIGLFSPDGSRQLMINPKTNSLVASIRVQDMRFEERNSPKLLKNVHNTWHSCGFAWSPMLTFLLSAKDVAERTNLIE